MRILLVTRGSQGDVLPYLAVASELARRGHDVTVNLPQIFEETIKPYRLKYVLQQFDDIGGMIDNASRQSRKFGPFLTWMRDVIDKQFEQLMPLMEENDLLVSTNSEFSAPSIAEYYKKPLIRTAYAPFLPGKKIPPATFPFPKPGKIITPGLLWKLMNRMSNYMVKGTINTNRVKLGLPPIKNFGYHAGENSYNYLMFSGYLGDTDPDWIFKWAVGGYCFNDTFTYNEIAYQEMMAYVKQDNRPLLFFTLGSCNSKDGNKFCQSLVRICKKHNYRLIAGSGWAKTGIELLPDKHLFLMKDPIPHQMIFPHCDGVIHHGGCGTTHSVARAGKPQIITPLIIDQPYWAYRLSQLGLGPGGLKISKATEEEIERKVCDLMSNVDYKQNAVRLSELIRKEEGVKNMCDYIERFKGEV